MMKLNPHNLKLSIGAAAGILLAASANAATFTPGAPADYELTGSYAHGCFDLCLCPVSFTDDVAGSFTLKPGFGVIVPDGLFSVQPFDVEDFELIVGASFGEGTTYTGSGTYAIVNDDGFLQHQLELDLTVDGRTFTHFDSGLVPLDSEFPEIDITVSIPGAFCIDTVVTIDAEPSAPVGDLTGDGIVDGMDLGLLLAMWSIPADAPGCSGLAIPAPCPADLNRDGLVNGLDLGILLSAWTLS